MDIFSPQYLSSIDCNIRGQIQRFYFWDFMIVMGKMKTENSHLVNIRPEIAEIFLK